MSDLLLAFHEAGHAIAAIAHGVPLKSVNLRETTQAVAMGDVVLTDAIVICLAAGAAERKFTGRAALLDANDRVQAQTLIGGVGGGWTEHHFSLLADDFVERHWPLIRRLAHRLLRERSISGADVLKFVREEACAVPGY
jgi:hypothetical protein